MLIQTVSDTSQGVVEVLREDPLHVGALDRLAVARREEVPVPLVEDSRDLRLPARLLHEAVVDRPIYPVHAEFPRRRRVGRVVPPEVRHEQHARRSVAKHDLREEWAVAEEFERRPLLLDPAEVELASPGFRRAISSNLAIVADLGLAFHEPGACVTRRVRIGLDPVARPGQMLGVRRHDVFHGPERVDGLFRLCIERDGRAHPEVAVVHAYDGHFARDLRRSTSESVQFVPRRNSIHDFAAQS